MVSLKMSGIEVYSIRFDHMITVNTKSIRCTTKHYQRSPLLHLQVSGNRTKIPTKKSRTILNDFCHIIPTFTTACHLYIVA